jgi:hypothetical protein
LAQKYEHIEALTEGTKEWRDAVQEVNKEITDLITKYPELAGLIYSDKGVLKIDLESEEA